MSKVNFLIVTGSYVCRTGLRFLLEELDVTGKIYLADDTDHITSTQADVLFVDTSLPLPQELLTTPRSERPLLVGIGHHHDHEQPRQRIPYDHLLDLSLTKSELLKQLNELIESEGYNPTTSSREEKLSEREKLILRYVALGFTNKEIAEKLFISTHTVITHRKNITRKIGIRTVSGLTIYALLNNLIEMDEINASR